MGVGVLQDGEQGGSDLEDTLAERICREKLRAQPGPLAWSRLGEDQARSDRDKEPREAPGPGAAKGTHPAPPTLTWSPRGCTGVFHVNTPQGKTSTVIKQKNNTQREHGAMGCQCVHRGARKDRTQTVIQDLSLDTSEEQTGSQDGKKQKQKQSKEAGSSSCSSGSALAQLCSEAGWAVKTGYQQSQLCSLGTVYVQRSSLSQDHATQKAASLWAQAPGRAH